MARDTALRRHIVDLLQWKSAHVNFDAAVKGLPPALRGKIPQGAPYSPWQLLEHLRLAQSDILEFCVDSNYREKAWPDDYWPKSPAPPSATSWSRSIRLFRADRKTLQKLAADTSVRLESRIPHGDGQTYLRELLLVADHSAYHVGQFVLVRRLLGAWP